MPTQSVEDYLKAVFVLDETGSGVSITRLAERLGVAASSVSAMVRRLAGEGLVEHTPFRAVTLTRRGHTTALRVVRRHRLIETFLYEVVGLQMEEVHAEAEVLEHVVSERLEGRIAEMLGHPRRDPHGDPIPPAEGDHEERVNGHVALAAVGSDVRVRVERIPDRDPAALRWLVALGLLPGTVAVVRRRDPFGGPVWVVGSTGRDEALGVELAEKVLVSLVDEGTGHG